MYFYIPDLVLNITVWLIFNIVFFFGFLIGAAWFKRKHKTINIELKNGSVKEVEEINQIINEVFDNRLKETK